MCAKWHLPGNRGSKRNIDAAQFANSNSTGIGMILRDDTGCILLTRTLCFPGKFRAEEVEAIGLFEVLSWIESIGVENVVVEMNVKLVADAVNKGEQDERCPFFLCFIHSFYLSYCQ
ncbi:hypothetical protein ACS0TY_010174 [Phlomoides rotata]